MDRFRQPFIRLTADREDRRKQLATTVDVARGQVASWTRQRGSLWIGNLSRLRAFCRQHLALRPGAQRPARTGLGARLANWVFTVWLHAQSQWRPGFNPHAREPRRQIRRIWWKIERTALLPYGPLAQLRRLQVVILSVIAAVKSFLVNYGIYLFLLLILSLLAYLLRDLLPL